MIMGFVDFLFVVAKAGIGIIIGFGLIMTASFTMVESTILGILLGIIGVVAILYGAYNLRQMDRKTF